jgi:F-type H+-transporting ATPase subunit delta
VIVDPVTARYADALFELARDKGRLEAVQKDVEALAAALTEGARAALSDARVPTEKKREALGALTGGFDELTRNFVGLLFDKHRETVLAGLGAAFKRRVLESQGATEGVVESARPLPKEELDRIAGWLGPKLEKRVILSNRVVPGLVGGVRVLADNRLIDQSVTGRLRGLRRRLEASHLPAPSA